MPRKTPGNYVPAPAGMSTAATGTGRVADTCSNTRRGRIGTEKGGGPAAANGSDLLTARLCLKHKENC